VPAPAAEVALVEDDDDRCLALEELLEDAVLVFAPAAGLGDEHAEVGAVEHLGGLPGAQLAEHADVVDAGGVDEEHGAERQQFHRLLDRVRGRAGEVADDADLLARDRVEQARLADVAAAEDADVKPQCLSEASDRPMRSLSHPCAVSPNYVSRPRDRGVPAGRHTARLAVETSSSS
jgi:hypothetical protein